jgi:xanthine dehydrogenase accessory factor
VLTGRAKIGDHVEQGQVVATVGDRHPVISPLKGVLRGLIRDGIHVPASLKIGDVDTRDDPSACFLVSDKALAIGGAVLEAILSREEIREEIFYHKGHKGH